MTSAGSSKPSLAELRWIARRSRLRDTAWPPRIDGGGGRLLAWLPSAAAALQETIISHGAVLLRDFACENVAGGLSAAIESVGGSLLAYDEQSSPRTALGHRIYTSTEYPRDQEIFFHNESSYAARFPGLLGFGCAVAAVSGGETPLIDVRAVHDRLPEPVRDRFARSGILYVRRHIPGLGIDWRIAYGSDDRRDVVRRLNADGYDVVWEGDTLEVRRAGPSVIEHPANGRRSWFNHAAFFHHSTLPPTIGAALLAELGEARLPSQTYYGDGAAIELEVLGAIRATYRDAAVWHGWERGDLLLIDNLSVAHGRAAYEGDRRILVGMARPYRTVGSGGVRAVEPCT